MMFLVIPFKDINISLFVPSQESSKKVEWILRPNRERCMRESKATASGATPYCHWPSTSTRAFVFHMYLGERGNN